MSELANKRRIPSRAFNIIASPLNPSRNTSIAWKPTFTGEGGQLKVTFSPGTVNGLLPSNMFEEFDAGGEETQYVLLKVTAGQDGITDTLIELQNDSTIENKFNEKYPPTEFKFVLGVISGSSYSMTASGPIGIKPELAYVEAKENPAGGESPYTYFYGWFIS